MNPSALAHETSPTRPPCQSPEPVSLTRLAINSFGTSCLQNQIRDGEAHPTHKSQDDCEPRSKILVPPHFARSAGLLWSFSNSRRGPGHAFIRAWDFSEPRLIRRAQLFSRSIKCPARRLPRAGISTCPNRGSLFFFETFTSHPDRPLLSDTSLPASCRHFPLPSRAQVSASAGRCWSLPSILYPRSFRSALPFLPPSIPLDHLPFPQPRRTLPLDYSRKNSSVSFFVSKIPVRAVFVMVMG